MTTTRYTPSNLELVKASDIVTGDVIVSFTPTGKNITIPPTARQLARLADNRIFSVPSVTSPRTGIVEFGTGVDRATYLLTASVWRVAR
jgi:hypothetical protein